MFLVELIGKLLIVAILIRALMTWFAPVRPGGMYWMVAHGLDRLTEPVIGPIRRRLPTFGGFDWAPLVAIVVVYLVMSIVLWVL
jgi:YggT family protein